MAHVAQWKETEVNNIKELLVNNPVIGLVNIQGIPGPQLQKMRQNLKNKATLKISKLKLIALALENIETKKKGIKKLEDKLEGQIGLIATDMNPFKLFKVLEESKTQAPAKGGEVLSEDIEIKAGETSFKPGPIVGELQRVGIPAAIEQGKVVIKADKMVLKAGEAVSPELAQILTRLEIYPLTVGLDLQAVFEDGDIFMKSELDIDPKQFLDKVSSASQSAFNLAMNINYPTHATVLPMLQRAHAQAMNLMFNAKIIDPMTIKFMLSKGFREMLSLASQISPEALDDELKSQIGAGASAAEVAVAPSPPPKPHEETGEKKTKEKDKSKDKGKDKKKEDDKEVSEEEAASGLGALFD